MVGWADDAMLGCCLLGFMFELKARLAGCHLGLDCRWSFPSSSLIWEDNCPSELFLWWSSLSIDLFQEAAFAWQPIYFYLCRASMLLTLHSKFLGVFVNSGQTRPPRLLSSQHWPGRDWILFAMRCCHQALLILDPYSVVFLYHQVLAASDVQTIWSTRSHQSSHICTVTGPCSSKRWSFQPKAFSPYPSRTSWKLDASHATQYAICKSNLDQHLWTSASAQRSHL